MEGPKPQWARTDGGEGGSHPSNVHDHVYAIGSINFTGDMPIALMPDGPSLGGFVCPATITSNEMWKMGQVRSPRLITEMGFDQGLAQVLRLRACPDTIISADMWNMGEVRVQRPETGFACCTVL